jgi:hypothetical protein
MNALLAADVSARQATPDTPHQGVETLLRSWDGEELITRYDRPTGA